MSKKSEINRVPINKNDVIQENILSRNGVEKIVSDNILKNNTESMNGFYDVIKEQLKNSKEPSEFYKFAESIHSTNTDVIKNSNLMEEEKVQKICDEGIKFLEIGQNLEHEKQAHEMKILDRAYQKETENKSFLAWLEWGTFACVIGYTLGLLKNKNG